MPTVPAGVVMSTVLVLLIEPPTKRSTPLVATSFSSPNRLCSS